MRVSLVADAAAEFRDAVLQLYRNQTLWEDISQGAARFSRSGGGGKGVCSAGIADDWRRFWSKLQVGSCGVRGAS